MDWCVLITEIFILAFVGMVLFVIGWATVPDRIHGKLFGKRALIVWLLLAIAAPLAHVWLSYHVWDTRFRRQLVSAQIREIAEMARENPDDPRYVIELIEIARDDYSFAACAATVAIGSLDEAATPVIGDLVTLMSSDNPVVSREAANSLSKLGPISEPALAGLEHQVEFGNPSQDTTCFAVDAIGHIGAPAQRSLPLLRSKLGVSEWLDSHLLRAIERLEISSTTLPDDRYCL